MAWTVAKIISTFRDLTGKKSSNQISDVDILAIVNLYFQYDFPGEVHIREFKGWYEFDTVAGTGSQAVPESVTVLSFPAYVNDDEATFWTGIQRFYEEYEPDYTDTGVPTDILLEDRTLMLRPIPDAVYAVKIRKKSEIPDALVSGNLDNSLWGPAIAYGSAIKYRMDHDDDVSDVTANAYQFYIAAIRHQVIRQRLVGTRPPGGTF